MLRMLLALILLLLLPQTSSSQKAVYNYTDVLNSIFRGDVIDITALNLNIPGFPDSIQVVAISDTFNTFDDVDWGTGDLIVNETAGLFGYQRLPSDTNRVEPDSVVVCRTISEGDSTRCEFWTLVRLNRIIYRIENVRGRPTGRSLPQIPANHVGDIASFGDFGQKVKTEAQIRSEQVRQDEQHRQQSKGRGK